MAQLILPFQYQEDTTGYSTAFAGLPLYFEMAVVSGVVQSIAHHVTLRQAGWDDISVVLSLILLNLAGGTCVEDIDRLEQDAGLRRIMIHAQYAHLPRGERRQREYHARRVYLKVSGAFCEYLKEWRMRISSCAQPRAG